MSTDVAPTPWSYWGNCLSNPCGTAGSRIRVRFCQWPPTASGGGTGAAVGCPTAVPPPAPPLSTTGFAPDPFFPLTEVIQTQTESGVGATCTGNAGAIPGTPYVDSCNVGKSRTILLNLT